MPPKDNLYLPKYIQNVPWYFKTGNEKTKTDELSHHRKDPNQAPIDHRIPQAGSGIRDEFDSVNGHEIRKDGDYSAKRDRWYGTTLEEWDEILAQWNTIKKDIHKPEDTNDSDDTDYELELQELGLETKDLRVDLKEDPLEKSIRDRRDVPAYILAINANEGGKIRLGQDSTAAIVNQDSDFVKQSDDVKELRQMQKFAWDQNREYEEAKQRELYQKQLESLSDPYAVVEDTVPVNLGLSVEASPTLMMLKNRQNEAERKKAVEKKKNALLDRYG